MSFDEAIPRAIADLIADAQRDRVRPPTLAEREAGHPLPQSQRLREEPATQDEYDRAHGLDFSGQEEHDDRCDFCKAHGIARCRHEGM